LGQMSPVIDAFLLLGGNEHAREKITDQLRCLIDPGGRARQPSA
jgi:hypothetical protein